MSWGRVRNAQSVCYAWDERLYSVDSLVDCVRVLHSKTTIKYNSSVNYNNSQRIFASRYQSFTPRY